MYYRLDECGEPLERPECQSHDFHPLFEHIRSRSWSLHGIPPACRASKRVAYPPQGTRRGGLRLDAG